MCGWAFRNATVNSRRRDSIYTTAAYSASTGLKSNCFTQLIPIPRWTLRILPHSVQILCSVHCFPTLSFFTCYISFKEESLPPSPGLLSTRGFPNQTASSHWCPIASTHTRAVPGPATRPPRTARCQAPWIPDRLGQGNGQD